jgi:hypothetical protein
MANRRYVFLLVASTILVASQNVRAQERAIENPKCSKMEPSLGKALCNAGKNETHILYIHGIGGEEAGGSWSFQKHITAFSDPSDLLSWHFPPIANAVVQNCTVRNTFWRWVIASPQGAHTNYAQNNGVLRIMINPEKYSIGSCSLSQ